MHNPTEGYRDSIKQQRGAAPSISCVVPAYNEAGNLPSLLQQLSAQLIELSHAWEIVVVDDGSSDATFAVMLEWTRLVGIRYLRLSRNFGKEAALTAGIQRAVGEVVILIDADLQHPVSLIPRMLEQWRAGYDCAYAVRATRHEESKLKRLGTAVLYKLLNIGGELKIPVNAGDYRLLDRRVVNALLALPERNRFMKGLYAWVGFNAIAVPFTPLQRASGKSSFSYRRLSRLGLTGLTAFSYLPLRIWSGVGAVVALIAFAYGTYISLDHLLFGNPVPGWTTLVAATMFFNGILLLSIGILGEYIGRIFEEVKRRPLYIVAGEIGTGHIQAATASAVQNPTAVVDLAPSAR
ncbi:MAG: glycosyltransferase family 2 protein [Gammaproteobacteria bacterium]|nr:glycosyltransferase family 2 protein [Gammaproteobacteria bacterium]